MRNRTLETAATAIVVASLIFGMVVTMPTTSGFGDVKVTSENGLQFLYQGFGPLQRPAQS
jgi:hypothetical protein